ASHGQRSMRHNSQGASPPQYCDSSAAASTAALTINTNPAKPLGFTICSTLAAGEMVIEVVTKTGEHQDDDRQVEFVPDIGEELQVLGEFDTDIGEEVAPDQRADKGEQAKDREMRLEDAGGKRD